MKVGFIGAGNVTGTFGRHLINAGHTVVVSNSRGPETLANFVAELGPRAIAGIKQQAAECDFVISRYTLGKRAGSVERYRLAWPDSDRCNERAYGS